MATLIIAHRGGAQLGTENSLSCIERGIQTGAQMVEVDLHLTADQQIVVCHDQRVNRTTNGSGKIENMTLTEIQALRLLRPDGSASEETIPTLEQVLQLCKGRCRLLLEIKKKRSNQYLGIEQLADSIVKAHGMQEQVVFQSFSDEVLFTLHKIDPSLRLEKLLICRIGKFLFDGSFTRFSWDKYESIASFNIFRWFAKKSFIEDMHRHGKEVKVWTVDDPSKAPANADGIITDRPDLFVK
ncbi:MAG: glycerophosphodiester phosphodiesterase family protein [Paludibacteraceae bacterium]|nr:glycerophosphodiester phosphodiesterase family protein [Paludibacteraceae bacterium]